MVASLYPLPSCGFAVGDPSSAKSFLTKGTCPFAFQPPQENGNQVNDDKHSF